MARMQSGAEFSQFDQMTSKEGKERIMNLESRVLLQQILPVYELLRALVHLCRGWQNLPEYPRMEI